MTNLVYLGTFTLAWYCHCAKCCGTAGQPTASGARPISGLTAAAPRGVPFGTRIYLEGEGWRVAQDRMRPDYERAGRIECFHWDGRARSSHRECTKRGIKPVKVWRQP